MEAWFDAFRSGGDVAALPFVWVLVALGALGLVGCIAALVANKHRLGLAIGVGALALAIACASLGGLSVVIERGRVDDAVARMEATADGRARTESARLRARRAGYERARAAAQLGLLSATAPLFGGLFGVLAPMIRRRTPRPMSMRMPRSIRSQAKYEWNTTNGGVLGLSVSAFALLAVGACAVVWTLPLPGPAIASKDPAWDAREAIDVMRDGAFDVGCARLADACRAACDEEKVPDLAGAATECAEIWLEAGREDPATLERLEAFARSSAPLGDAERQRIKTEVALIRAPRPAPTR